MSYQFWNPGLGARLMPNPPPDPMDQILHELTVALLHRPFTTCLVSDESPLGAPCYLAPPSPTPSTRSSWIARPDALDKRGQMSPRASSFFSSELGLNDRSTSSRRASWGL